MTTADRFFALSYLAALPCAWVLGFVGGYLKRQRASDEAQSLFLLATLVVLLVYILADAILTAEPSRCVARAVPLVPIEAIGLMSISALWQRGPFDNLVTGEIAYYGSLLGLIYGGVSTAGSLVSRRIRNAKARATA